MNLTDTEKEVIVAGLKLLEPLADELIPAPGNLLARIALRAAEADIAAGIVPGADEIEKMRAEVYGDLQNELTAKFAVKQG